MRRLHLYWQFKVFLSSEKDRNYFNFLHKYFAAAFKIFSVIDFAVLGSFFP
jgi:hypothetical protein